VVICRFKQHPSPEAISKHSDVNSDFFVVIVGNADSELTGTRKKPATAKCCSEH